MADRSFLGDMLTTIFERRRTPPASGDDRTLTGMCLALLDAEGEVSGLTLAQSILERYAGSDEAEKLAFFHFLNDKLDIDLAALSGAIQTYRTTQSPIDYRSIRKISESRRQELLRRLNQPPGATQALVNMRADLLKAQRDAPELSRTDSDFQTLLKSWFNRGFLVLRQISWETPASILEKIVQYEAVHAIGDWDDLRRRLYPEDRRCFAYFHPSMPDEPLIFVEVALTKRIPSSIQQVLADEREHRAAHETRVAVFYSISNCQKGLKGVSFGNLLIKQVVAELQQELPNLETFVTLSPIPSFRKWLGENLGEEAVETLMHSPAGEDGIRIAATDYLLHAKNKSGAPYDPVARFHLGNGAQIYAIHSTADLSEKGKSQSLGAMVNYQYDLDAIEQNHEKFVQFNAVCTSPAFASTTLRPAPKRKIM